MMKNQNLNLKVLNLIETKPNFRSYTKQNKIFIPCKCFSLHKYIFGTFCSQKFCSKFASFSASYSEKLQNILFFTHNSFMTQKDINVVQYDLFPPQKNFIFVKRYKTIRTIFFFCKRLKWPYFLKQLEFNAYDQNIWRTAYGYKAYVISFQRYASQL